MKKQRLLSLLLAITTVLAMIPSLFLVATAAERTKTEVELTEQDKDADGYYVIPADAASVKIDEVIYTVVDSAAQMNAIAKPSTAIVNITQNIILANNLDYNGKDFVKIVMSDAIFDGNGFGMYNYSVIKDEDADPDPSSFSAVGTTAVEIRNLTIGKQGSPIQVGCSTGYQKGASPVVGVTTGPATLSIQNVDVYADIKIEKNTANTECVRHIGAFVACYNKGAGTLSVKDCYFEGTIEHVGDATANFGGAVGVATAKSCTLENVTVNTTIKHSGGATTNFGGAVGIINGTTSTLENVTVNATINHAGGTTTYFGGAVGVTNSTNSTFENVTVNAKIYKTETGKISYFGGAVGGIAGTSCELNDVTVNAEIENKKASGGDWGCLIGYPTVANLTMRDCAVYGSFYSEQGVMFGGLIGRHKTTTTTQIINCENHADITFKTATDITGGLIGVFDSTAADVTMENCVNYGDLNLLTTASKGVIGGLIGCARNTGSVTIKNCLNAGAVSGYQTAGIVCQLGQGADKNLPSSVEIQNCVNIGELKCSNSRAGIVLTKYKEPTITNCVTNAYDAEGNVTYADGAGEALTIQNAIKAIREMKDATTKKPVFDDIVFAANDDGTTIVVVGSDDTAAVAEAKFLQYKKTANGLDIRVIGVLNESDLTKYADAGFEFTFKKDGDVKHTQTEKTNMVYTSIIATEGQNIQTTYTAEDLCAEYLYAVELYKIPLKGTYTIEVKAFVTEIGATTPTYDNLVVITVVDGVIQ
ncbi:MAG: hypothetical protein IKC59_05780 [Clostridia bacterium]|nr:hypothetical protein [Clostridia bacterium]